MSPSFMKIGQHKDGKQMQLIDDIDLCTLGAIVKFLTFWKTFLRIVAFCAEVFLGFFGLDIYIHV